MEPRDDRTESERDRWALSEEAFQELKEAHAAVKDAFLDPETKLPNVVGLGMGIKLVGGSAERGTLGEPTGEPALQVFVSQKLPREALAENELIPSELAGKPTDVIEVGRPMINAFTQRIRPVRGGCSVSDFGGGAGTIACGAWSTRLNKGFGGVGAPLILSNNHVLADSNQNRWGASILQPAYGDGGRLPADKIGRLLDFEPIDFFPPLPLVQHRNLVDAATATVDLGFAYLDRQIFWSGYVRGFTSVTASLIGKQVKKTGRTSQFTIGVITTLNATLDIGGYPGGAQARFDEVIITTLMTAPGDSGSLLTTFGNIAIGLGFASGSSGSFFNPIEHV